MFNMILIFVHHIGDGWIFEDYDGILGKVGFCGFWIK